MTHINYIIYMGLKQWVYSVLYVDKIAQGMGLSIEEILANRPLRHFVPPLPDGEAFKARRFEGGGTEGDGGSALNFLFSLIFGFLNPHRHYCVFYALCCIESVILGKTAERTLYSQAKIISEGS